jgi:hypothetical protein
LGTDQPHFRRLCRETPNKSDWLVEPSRFELAKKARVDKWLLLAHFDPQFLYDTINR